MMRSLSAGITLALCVTGVSTLTAQASLVEVMARHGIEAAGPVGHQIDLQVVDRDLRWISVSEHGKSRERVARLSKNGRLARSRHRSEPGS